VEVEAMEAVVVEAAIGVELIDETSAARYGAKSASVAH
jgi:hypothetical protein